MCSDVGGNRDIHFLRNLAANANDQASGMLDATSEDSRSDGYVRRLAEVEWQLTRYLMS